MAKPLRLVEEPWVTLSTWYPARSKVDVVSYTPIVYVPLKDTPLVTDSLTVPYPSIEVAWVV